MDYKEHTGPLTERDFNRFYENFRNMYVNIAYSYVHDLCPAEDIVNESFIRLWQKRDEVRTGNYESYMFKIVMNRCLDWLKSHKARTRSLEQMQDQGMALLDFEIASLESCNPAEVFRSEVWGLLNKSVERMPESTGKIFIASRYEGLTYEKIAAKFGIPVRKVTAEIQAALRFLRPDLHDYLPMTLITLVLQAALSLSPDEAFGEKQFRYLNRVGGGTLTEVVGDAPQVEAVLHGVVAADTTDEHLVPAAGVERSGIDIA